MARVAYVKYGFTEAPGLVKFEQEIDKELQLDLGDVSKKNGFSGAMKHYPSSNRDSLFDISSPVAQVSGGKRVSSQARTSIGDATDELVMRYCRHKEEEAARKRKEAETAALAQEHSTQIILEPVEECADSSLVEENNFTSHNAREADGKIYEPDSLALQYDPIQENCEITSTSEIKLSSPEGKNFIADHGRVDSLDSGEGPTESASTAHSGVHMADAAQIHDNAISSSFQVPTTREPDDGVQEKSPSSRTISNCATENSELSSSRSSLFSNQDGDDSTSKYGRPITSDLDGKVMRIAKSYYGKKATRDVTRLSEGKYKIADRIVFVRLLKGHRVMVRIGGGWDTLENFLFRHKSDPTQVIDPDNLLPIETKMLMEKSVQITAKNTPSRSPATISKLPNYRRSNSASSTNLSLTNLSFSNVSLSSYNNSQTSSKRIPPKTLSNTTIGILPYDSAQSVDHNPRHQIPRLMIHNGQPLTRAQRNNLTLYAKGKEQNRSDTGLQPIQISNAQVTSTPKSALKRPQNHSNSRIQQRTPATPQHGPNRSMQFQRPLASSKAPAVSVTNLYPGTLAANRAK